MRRGLSARIAALNGFRYSSGPAANPFLAKNVKSTPDGKFFDAQGLGAAEFQRLPFSIRVLLESAMRNCDDFAIKQDDVNTILNWEKNIATGKDFDVPFMPARVILQDFTGVPCVTDLAAMRDAIVSLGGDASKINPMIPVDLVIDHSVQVDKFGTPTAAADNQSLEFKRNEERFRFLKWGANAFNNLQIVPPGSGIVHQVNLEYLAKVVYNRNGFLFPDSVVGTDSHTTMINGLGVLGWGVGGIEAEAAMLGQASAMVLPRVVGVKLVGRPKKGTTATDIVLGVTHILRKHGVVGKFVEFYGEGVDFLSLADRATLANMAPEYGATCGFFPVDEETLNYLKLTNRSPQAINTIANYLKASGMFRTGAEKIQYTENVVFDLQEVVPSVAGPKRPQDRVAVANLQADFNTCFTAKQGHKGFGQKPERRSASVAVTLDGGHKETIKHGDVVIAAITSCTNTSNPAVLITAGLVAKAANERGLKVRKTVKTSLSPGSHVVTGYLKAAGLQEHFDALGFTTAGYGCMTCIGNSGELVNGITEPIKENDIVAAAVLSGNRNFEARVHPNVAAAYLASPPLVVAYALAGTVDIDFAKQPIGQDKNGKDVFLSDIWPAEETIQAAIRSSVTQDKFKACYDAILSGSTNLDWKALDAGTEKQYKWNPSTYISKPPYFNGMTKTPKGITNVTNARVLLYLGDSITTDHISPAGNIAATSPAAKFLESNGVKKIDFNTYGSRRGNDLIMVRGTFANVRLGNKIIGEGQTGPKTIHFPSSQTLSVFDAAEAYKKDGTPLVVVAGKEYGSGSSRDWAAKGTMLLGVKVVIAESYERIHRSNLIGMGVVPLQFLPGETAATHGITGKETFSFDFSQVKRAGETVKVVLDGGARTFTAKLRVDTDAEIAYWKHGGILNLVLRNMAFGA